jgi:subtilisin-like proprotein convertase family protein
MKTLWLFSFILISQACVKSGSSSDSSGPAGEVSSSGPDPLVPYAWHLENTGQSSFALNSGLSGEDIKVQQVIDMGIKGNGVRIAVSDSGVDILHPDLAGNQLASDHRNYSLASNWHGGDPSPAGGGPHGTAVTGLVSALGWNGIGSRGVAPSSHFAGFYFLGDFHDTTSSYEAKTIDQMSGNFDIFNYSYGYSSCNFTTTTSSIVDAYFAGVTNLRGGKGAIYVKAAGNDYRGLNSDCNSSDTSYYAGNANTSEDQNVPYIILAAAVNASGTIASYSTPGSGVWVSSTGGEYGDNDPAMITTDLRGCSAGFSLTSSTASDFNSGDSDFNLLCNYTNIMNGTSSATPTLAGVIALMLEANPNLTWRDVKHILAESADTIQFSTAAINHPFNYALAGHVYDNLYVTNAAGYNFSNTFGFGRVNAHAAVLLAQTYSSTLGTYQEALNPNSSNWYYNSGTVNLSVPDNSSTGVSSIINVKHNYRIESVQIKISTDHTLVGDLGVELTSPSGIISKLLLINSNISQSGLTDFMLITNAFYGETSLGDWTIKVIDGAAGNTGRLESWQIKVNGHNITGTGDTTAPNAITGLTAPSPNASLVQTPLVTFTASTSPDVLRYEVSVGTISGGQDKAKWYSIGNTTSFQTTGLSLLSGHTYYINVRTIDTSENISSVVNASWVTN